MSEWMTIKCSHCGVRAHISQRENDGPWTIPKRRRETCHACGKVFAAIPQYPDQLWAVLDSKDRREVRRQWRTLVRWVDDSEEEPGGTTVIHRIVDMLDYLKDKRVRGPLQVLIYYITTVREGGDEDWASEQLHAVLKDMNAVLKLYRECMGMKERGYEGPPRDIWEARHGLGTGERRWQCALSEMRRYGFLRR